MTLLLTWDCLTLHITDKTHSAGPVHFSGIRAHTKRPPNETKFVGGRLPIRFGFTSLAYRQQG